VSKRRDLQPLAAYRSLGLSLAIIAVFALYGIVPTLPALLIVIVRVQGRTFQPINGAFWALPIIAIGTMAVCVFAWVGAPRRARVMFIGIVLLGALVNGFATYRTDLLTFVSALDGGVILGNSFDPIFAGALRCLLPIRVALALFVVWYCNRAVVRAFYK